MSDDDTVFVSAPYRPAAANGPAMSDDNPQAPIGEPQAPRAPVVFKNVVAFCAEYVPLAYVLEGIVRTSSLYGLTGKTSAGKTSFLVAAALAVATGRDDILGIDVTKGRVAYVACENPDDVRMRLMIGAFTLNIDLNEIIDRVLILDRQHTPEDIVDELKRLADKEPFTQIISETFGAFFDGKDVNDAVQGGGFARRLRPLTQIAGLPAVIVSCHPVKNANDEQLIPYGSGAILNELDGNLTLWKTETGVVFHWQSKLRGLDFPPLRFYFDIVGSPDILDVKRRQVCLPVIRPSDEASVENRKQVELDTDRTLVAYLIENEEATLQDCATAIAATKWSAKRRLTRLEKDGVLTAVLGKWFVTNKGKRAPRKKNRRGSGDTTDTTATATRNDADLTP